MSTVFGLLVLFALCVQTTVAVPTLLKRDAPFDSVKTNLRYHHQDEDKKEPDKYFHEAKFDHHYDGRFAEKKLSYDERRTHLSALLQTYLGTMRDIGAENWIMHGTLLGWWWNQKILPWDSDLDVMVSEKAIHHIAEYYNMTMHRYKLPGVEKGRDYLLEVNPHYTNATLESANKIDARWIDTDTGLYIDITTLRRNATADHDSVTSCWVKDNHHYAYDDIFPLRETTFEGFTVNVPFAHGEILIEEYGERALSNVFFQNHHFDPDKKEWLPITYASSPRVNQAPPQPGISYWSQRVPSQDGN
ncbi:hypothetical protein LTR08_004200 [Meristemomyces frigidus]|nr:hypothetical protein LTR08_004200 [Meristemomyces frigidus]